MKKFVDNFDFNDLDIRTWSSITNRLVQEIKKDESFKSRHEYLSPPLLIKIEPKNNEFDGIFNYLQTHGNIKNELDITFSSSTGNDPFGLLQYDDKEEWFETGDSKNSWICFEFKNHQVIPSDYIIRSYKGGEANNHPKAWKIEGSTDKQKWIPLDSQTNNDEFKKGASRVHLFHISNNEHNNEPFKYLRLQQTGQNWDNNHRLLLNSIEFYGKII